MNKKLLILTLALLIALPVLGLAAADLTATPAPEAQTTTPETTAPQTGFVDADGDGLCDNCGNALGTNPDAPGFIDENKDGVCDHFGTDQQVQEFSLMQGMRGRMQQMMGRRQGMMGRGQGMMGRGQGMMGRDDQGQVNNAQGNAQCPNYADANNDGVCDNLGTGTQQGFGGCGNRR